jgi:hypothetical protein
MHKICHERVRRGGRSGLKFRLDGRITTRLDKSGWVLDFWMMQAVTTNCAQGARFCGASGNDELNQSANPYAQPTQAQTA